MTQNGHMQACCLLVTLFDLSTVALKDRRLTLASLLDTFGENSIIIIGKCFKSIAVLADVTFKLAANLFRNANQTSSADASKLRMNNLNMVYKEGDTCYLWLDPYVGNLIKNLLFSKLEFCTKRLAFLRFNFSGVALEKGQFQVVEKTETWREVLSRLDCAGSDILNNVGSGFHRGGGHTLPVYFEQELDEDFEATVTTYVICEKDSNYDKPSTPNYCQNSNDCKNTIRDTPKMRTRYTSFVECITRLATFCNCSFFTDRQTFAHLGFFYKGQSDRVCCYECGITLSNWRKGDDPLLEHIRYSPECRHLATVIDPVFLASCKNEFQRRQVKNSNFGARGVRQVRLSSQWNNKTIRSPEYSFHSVRLSTFARFPVIPGINVHILAAAGFYYTGQEDIVRCYACDGGLKKWAPGDDAWEEHCKWFPDCPHLEQSNYNLSRRNTNAEGIAIKTKN
ncbi:hypothetical protein CHS0354_034255 [Potamilus streckersoni]|uniref:Uncharacterized protein n=1 Tax=Potamilus streckersoni TaxID=2493646 RepID=A0AAE0S4H5_9BIVA|nr:hypothetical protein CHS0354_034255 [Potamilus streckersoni]